MTQNFRISESFKESGSERAVKSEIKSEVERSKIAVLHHPRLQTPNAKCASGTVVCFRTTSNCPVVRAAYERNVHPWTRTGPGPGARGHIEPLEQNDRQQTSGLRTEML